MRLKNRSVVVTGASSGMGKAIVELFVKEGANVIAVARRKERLDALAASLSEEAGRIIVMKGDISLREDNEAMIELALSSFGRLDVLVNNAGIMDDMSPIGDVEDERYERVMKTNVYGPMCAMRKAVDVFTKQESGDVYKRQGHSTGADTDLRTEIRRNKLRQMCIRDRHQRA